MKAHNKKKCIICHNKLIRKQTKFCSIECKSGFYNTAYRQRNIGLKRKKLLILQKENKCEICSYSKNSAALSFHHRDPSKKKFPLDLRNCANRSYKNLLKELKKCQLLCLNCHSEIEHPSYTN